MMHHPSAHIASPAAQSSWPPAPMSPRSAESRASFSSARLHNTLGTPRTSSTPQREPLSVFDSRGRAPQVQPGHWAPMREPESTTTSRFAPIARATRTCSCARVVFTTPPRWTRASSYSVPRNTLARFTSARRAAKDRSIPTANWRSPGRPRPAARCGACRRRRRPVSKTSTERSAAPSGISSTRRIPGTSAGKSCGAWKPPDARSLRSPSTTPRAATAKPIFELAPRT